MRAAVSTPAMSMSSRMFSVPPMSARERLARTSLTPENEGLPRLTIMPLAALVSASRRCTVAASVEGESAAARALASSLTAWCASMASIAGSSSVAADFSYCVILSS